VEPDVPVGIVRGLRALREHLNPTQARPEVGPHLKLRQRRRVGDRVQKVFLLSPAKVSGARAGLLLNPNAPFALARQFQREGLPLAEVFTFASGLYFRGKITYARFFAAKRSGTVVRVITTNSGLLDPETMLTPESLRAFGTVDIHENDARYHGPLKRDACGLASKLGKNGVAVLLGSIATAKYRDVLLDCFGDKLVFPKEFIGRGDMSRGALLLRAAKADTELEYIKVAGAVYSGQRATRIAEMKIASAPGRRTPRNTKR